MGRPSSPRRGWRGWARLLGLVGLCLLGCTASAQQKAVEIRPTMPAILPAGPGQILTLSYRVLQQRDTPGDYEETLILPEGWQAVIPAGHFHLPANGSLVRILAVQIPGAVPAGTYPIVYAVRDRTQPDHADHATITVQVLPTTRLALLVLQRPDALIAGERAEAIVRVVNQGNQALALTLAAQASTGIVRPTSTRLQLQAGTSTAVSLLLEVDPRQKQARSMQVSLVAQADGMKPPEGRATLVFTVDIILKVSATASIKHLLPTTMTLRMSGTGGSTAFQGAWQGQGILKDGGRAWIDFLLQAPDTSRSNTLGTRDEYRLSYHRDQLDLHLGDTTCGLSQLTKFHRFGRGVALNMREGALGDCGLFLLTTRWQQPAQQTLAGYLTPLSTPDGRIRVNLLSLQERSTREQRTVNDRLGSVETAFTLAPGMRLQAEYGRSESDRQGMGADDAYRIELSGRVAELGAFHYRTIHAGPNYVGDYQDCRYASGTLTLPFSPYLQGTATFATWRRNLELRPDRTTAPAEEMLLWSFRYALPRGYYLTYGMDRFEREDLLLEETEHVRETTHRIGLGGGGPRFRWSMDLRDGTRHDLITGADSHVQDGRASLTYRPSRERFFTLYGGQRNDDREGFLLGSGNYLGGSINWRPSSKFSLIAWYTGYNIIGEMPQANQAELNATYLFSDARSLALKMRKTSPNTEGRSTSYELTYTFPLDIPLGKRKDLGSIVGRIVDAEKPGRPPLPRVILLLNGARAITDARGYFRFQALPAGTYTLTVDPRSLGLERVIQEAFPRTIVLRPGEKINVELGALTAATVKGIVRLAPALSPTGTPTGAPGTDPAVIGNPQTPEVKCGLRGILVELTNGLETHRRLTDDHGAFLFEGLRPGAWSCTVYDHNIPSYHFIEQPNREVIVQPGDTAELEVLVRPKVRRIIIIDEEANSTPVIQRPVASTR